MRVEANAVMPKGSGSKKSRASLKILEAANTPVFLAIGSRSILLLGTPHSTIRAAKASASEVEYDVARRSFV